MLVAVKGRKLNVRNEHTVHRGTPVYSERGLYSALPRIVVCRSSQRALIEADSTRLGSDLG